MEPEREANCERAIDWLRAEYQGRRQRNDRYSLTAFARLLGVGSGRLSELMAGKRRLTLAMGARIADRLNYDVATRDRLFELIRLQRAGATAVPAATEHRRVVEADVFHVIADWYHYGLLSLVETSTFHADIAWIARRLEISTTEARAALERLLRLGILTWREGQLVPGTAPLTTSQDIPSSAIRRFHSQHLELASAALSRDLPAARDLSGMTMAIDPAKLPEAKALVREFRRRVAALLETGERSEVYHLAIQLYPLSREH